MIQYLRSFIYFVWLYGNGIVQGILFVPVIAFGQKAAMGAVRNWARMMRWGLRVFVGATTEFRGTDHLPDGPYIYAAKHQSMYDVFSSFIVMKNPAIIMKRELLWYPAFGWWALALRMIPIDRAANVKALKMMRAKAKERADQGRTILIFPEGTRIKPGETAKYKPGVYGLYESLGIPVVPVATNSGLVWPRSGIKRHKGHVVFEMLEPIEPGLDRKTFMARLQGAIDPACDKLVDEGLAVQGRTRADL